MIFITMYLHINKRIVVFEQPGIFGVNTSTCIRRYLQPFEISKLFNNDLAVSNFFVKKALDESKVRTIW